MNRKSRLPKRNWSSSKDARLLRMFVDQHMLTEKQDALNIQMLKALDDDTDPRWIPLHMIDNANAIILHISRLRGNPKAIDKLYLKEKIDGLRSKLSDVDLKKGWG